MSKTVFIHKSFFFLFYVEKTHKTLMLSIPVCEENRLHTSFYIKVIQSLYASLIQFKHLQRYVLIIVFLLHITAIYTSFETLTLKWFFNDTRQQSVSVHWNERNTHPHELGFSLLCPSLNLNRCYTRSSHLRNPWNVTRKRGKFARHVLSRVIIHTWTVRISVIS